MNTVIEDFDEYYDKFVSFLKQRSVNVDTSHRCLLECKFCSRQNADFGKRYIKEYGASYGDLTPKHGKWLADNFKTITLCGQISDPIYHTNLHQLIESFNQSTHLQRIDFHTNGSGKKQEWWDKTLQLCNDSPHAIKWVFGIDGIDQKCSIHRKNQDFESAFNAMKFMAKNLYGTVVWQFIPFEYNENEIDEALKIANDLDIELLLLKSSRFWPSGPVSPPKSKSLKSDNNFAERVVLNEKRNNT